MYDLLLEYDKRKKSKSSKPEFRGGDSHPYVKKLRDLLSKDIVNFTFVKLDGSKRKAVGTRNIDIVRAIGGNSQVPKGVRVPSPRVLTFWDLQKKAWRCCRKDRIISIGKHYPWNGKEFTENSEELSESFSVMREYCRKEFDYEMKFESVFDKVYRSAKGEMNDGMSLNFAVLNAMDEYDEEIENLDMNDELLEYFCESLMSELELSGLNDYINMNE